jgi:hypothetical protein
VCPFPWPPVQRKRQPSGLAGPFNHPSNAHPAERLAALIDEHVGPLDPVSLLLPVQDLETVHLIPLQVVDAISAALEPVRPVRQYHWDGWLTTPTPSPETATDTALASAVIEPGQSVSPET